MTNDPDHRPVLSGTDRALLRSTLSPTDGQLEANRRAIRTRIAALAAGAAVAHAASSAHATGAATTAATTAAAATTAKGLASLGAAKWISAGLIVTAVASGTVVATRQSRSSEHAPEDLRKRAAPASGTDAPVEPSAASTPPSEPMIIAPVPTAAAAPVVEAVARDPRPVTVKGIAKRSREPRVARAVGRETLSGELALLHGARQALARGDEAAALQALDVHAARYPNAVLHQEALSARALALCAAGRTAEARRAAQQLARLAPRSPHLIRLGDSCAQIDPADSSE